MGVSEEISTILFTESREFLVNKAGERVKADEIADKVVALLIGPHWLPAPLEQAINLIQESCEELQSKALVFVYVAVERDEELISTIKMYGQSSQLDERPDEECFANVLSKLPDGCLALPLEDVETRSKIAKDYKAGIFTLAFLGSDGSLHSDQGLVLLEKWGAEGYPFTEDRIAELRKAVEEKRANQDLETLLVRGKRDVLISPSGTEVKVAELQGKTVLIYFSAHWCPPCRRFTPVLTSIYTELRDKGEDFEIVFSSSDESQEAFTEYFKDMPWLAVPYDDETTRKELSNWFEVEGIPTLVVLDKQGKTVTTEGMELVYKHGLEGYPFTQERLEELKHAEEAKRAAQTLETLLVTEDRDYVESKYGQVKVASLVGKTVGLYFSAHWCPPCRNFTPKLKSVYDELKGRGEEFEIIFLSSDRDEESFREYYGSMPWLALPFQDNRIRNLSQYFDIAGIPALVIIGRNGKTVTTDGRGLIGLYGVDAFPFTEDRLQEVQDNMKKKYSDLPKQVSSEKHEHLLVLTDQAYGGQIYICDDCSEQGIGWTYHCDVCGFDLHPECIGETKKQVESEHPSEGVVDSESKSGYVCEGDVCYRVDAKEINE